MKKHIDIKLLLFGIALIAFSPYAQAFYNQSNPGIFVNLIILIGTFSPIIGLILCIVGLFAKDKKE